MQYPFLFDCCVCCPSFLLTVTVLFPPPFDPQCPQLLFTMVGVPRLVWRIVSGTMGEEQPQNPPVAAGAHTVEPLPGSDIQYDPAGTNTSHSCTTKQSRTIRRRWPSGGRGFWTHLALCMCCRGKGAAAQPPYGWWHIQHGVATRTRCPVWPGRRQPCRTLCSLTAWRMPCWQWRGPTHQPGVPCNPMQST